MGAFSLPPNQARKFFCSASTGAPGSEDLLAVTIERLPEFKNALEIPLISLGRLLDDSMVIPVYFQLLFSCQASQCKLQQKIELQSSSSGVALVAAELRGVEPARHPTFGVRSSGAVRIVRLPEVHFSAKSTSMLASSAWITSVTGCTSIQLV